jgi:hypothetical protein
MEEERADAVEVVVRPHVRVAATRLPILLMFVANQHRSNSSSFSTISTREGLKRRDAGVLAPRAQREEGRRQRLGCPQPYREKGDRG